jgi:hypothetical protein
VDEAVRECTDYYRRYHSSRYVRDLFVMRMNSPLPADMIERLNDTYQGILTGDRITQHPGPVEGEQGDHPEKPRLVLRFDRRSVGRLRLLINDVNDA